jgi:outer membrane protein OmpU
MLMLESIPGKEPFIMHSCRGMSVGNKIESYNPRERIMKKVLLTTTALVMTAGVAAAEVSFSGKAQVSLTDDNSRTYTGYTSISDDMQFTSGYDFDVTVSATSDNGITMSGGFDMGGGHLVDYDDDDRIEAQGAAVGSMDVAVSYAGWTLTVDQNGIDNAYTDDAAEQDASLSGSLGGLSLTVTADLEDDHNSYSAAYSMGDFAFTASGTNDDEANGDASAFSVKYTMGDLAITYKTADEANDAEDDSSVSLAYSMDAITLTYTSIEPGGTNKDFGDEWDMKVAYAAGPLSASFNVDEADATTMIAEYDLGGGVTAFAAQHDKADDTTDLTTVGMTFKF